MSSIGIAQISNGTGTCKFMALKPPYSVVTANHFKHVPMNQDVIRPLNEVTSQDIHPIPVDLIFRYHGADLIDQTLHSESDTESKHLSDTKSHIPAQRLEDAPEVDNSTLKSSAFDFDSYLQEM